MFIFQRLFALAVKLWKMFWRRWRRAPCCGKCALWTSGTAESTTWITRMALCVTSRRTRLLATTSIPRVSDTDQQLWHSPASLQAAVRRHWMVTSVVLHPVACNTQQLWHSLVPKPWIFITTAARTSNLTFWCFLTLSCNLIPFCSSSLSFTHPPPPPHPFLQSNLLSPSFYHCLSLCSRMFPTVITNLSRVFCC